MIDETLNLTLDRAALRSETHSQGADGAGRPLTDPAGRLCGPEPAEATEEGGWADHVKLDSDAGREQQKHSSAVRRDGLAFGSRWYEK